jgi:hypothetical protein
MHTVVHTHAHMHTCAHTGKQASKQANKQTNSRYTHTHTHTHMHSLKHTLHFSELRSVRSMRGDSFSVIGGPCKRYAVTPTRMPGHNCLPGPQTVPTLPCKQFSRSILNFLEPRCLVLLKICPLINPRIRIMAESRLDDVWAAPCRSQILGPFKLPTSRLSKASRYFDQSSSS